MAATKTTSKTTASAANTSDKTTKPVKAKAPKAAKAKTAKTAKAPKTTKAKAPKVAKAKAAKTTKAKAAKVAKPKTAKAAKATTKKTKKTAKTTKPKVAKLKSTKRKSATAKKGKNTVAAFLSDVVKQAAKVQKKAQVETKVWIKKLNTQDKQLSQLTKKTIKAKGKSKTSLDKKISKLQSDMSVTRAGLLAAENSMDKVATLSEWVSQLNSKPAVTAYLSPKTSSKPTLVKNTSTKKPAAPVAPVEEEDYLEENDEEMNFLFGEDDDEEANR